MKTEYQTKHSPDGQKYVIFIVALQFLVTFYIYNFFLSKSP